MSFDFIWWSRGMEMHKWSMGTDSSTLVQIFSGARNIWESLEMQAAEESIRVFAKAQWENVARIHHASYPVQVTVIALRDLLRIFIPGRNPKIIERGCSWSEEILIQKYGCEVDIRN